jgi:hypothetical protein
MFISFYPAMITPVCFRPRQNKSGAINHMPQQHITGSLKNYSFRLDQCDTLCDQLLIDQKLIT